jgi:hypothetical protein
MNMTSRDISDSNEQGSHAAQPCYSAEVGKYAGGPQEVDADMYQSGGWRAAFESRVVGWHRTHVWRA